MKNINLKPNRNQIDFTLKYLVICFCYFQVNYKLQVNCKLSLAPSRFGFL